MIYKKYNTTPSQTPQYSNPCSPLSSWSAFDIGWLLWAQAINWKTGRVKSGLHTTTQCLDGKGMPQSWVLVSSLADSVLLWKWWRVWEEQGRDVVVVWQHPIARDKVEHSINTAKNKLQLANIPPMSHNTLCSPAYHISIPASAAQITAAAASAPPTVACSHIIGYSVWACSWVQPLGLKWMEPFMMCGVSFSLHPSSYKPHSLISTCRFDQCKAMPPCGIVSNVGTCQWQWGYTLTLLPSWTPF